MIRAMDNWFLKSVVASLLLMVATDAVLIQIDASRGLFAVGIVATYIAMGFIIVHFRERSQDHSP